MNFFTVKSQDQNADECRGIRQNQIRLWSNADISTIEDPMNT